MPRLSACSFLQASPMSYFEPDSSLLSSGEKRKITRLRKDLLAWFSLNGRNFPWRNPGASDFQKICVELLLQRTRAETVAAVYPHFFKRFNNWQELVYAPASELEERLRPIGLWRRRAVSIKGLAVYAAERGGAFPSCPLELAKVPGVGQYVMNAILLFQHGENRPLLDVNMARVLERFVRPRIRADIRFDPWLQAAAHWLVRDLPIETNWATLDFAAAICASRRPSCGACIVSQHCNWEHRLVLRP
jgi:A/G-specific adenine glycosylase